MEDDMVINPDTPRAAAARLFRELAAAALADEPHVTSAEYDTAVLVVDGVSFDVEYNLRKDGGPGQACGYAVELGCDVPAAYYAACADLEMSEAAADEHLCSMIWAAVAGREVAR